MKKTLLILLAVVLLLSFCSCSESSLQGNATSEILITDNEYIVFKIIDEYVDDSDADNVCYVVKVFLENKTENNISVCWDNTTINGNFCNPSWKTDMSMGEKAESEIRFPIEILENNEIDTEGNKSFSFTLSVLDRDYFDISSFMSEPFEFSTADLYN